MIATALALEFKAVLAKQLDQIAVVIRHAQEVAINGSLA
jgi:hypothetical protein